MEGFTFIVEAATLLPGMDGIDNLHYLLLAIPQSPLQISESFWLYSGNKLCERSYLSNFWSKVNWDFIELLAQHVLYVVEHMPGMSRVGRNTN